IKDNVDEALAGVKGELSIKLFGPDVFTLEAKAKEVAGVLGAIHGVADLDYDHLVGQPQLQIVVDRKAAARYGINVQDVQDAIEWSVRERDMGGLVAEAVRKVEGAVKLADGYRMVWSGRFEDQQRALARLYIIVPLVTFIIFVMLFGTFQSVAIALLIMLNLPFALIGGTMALYLSHTNFNISAAVGYIAVFGVSVLKGLVLVTSIMQAQAEGLALLEAVVRGCEIGLRAIGGAASVGV